MCLILGRKHLAKKRKDELTQAITQTDLEELRKPAKEVWGCICVCLLEHRLALTQLHPPRLQCQNWWPFCQPWPAASSCCLRKTNHITTLKKVINRNSSQNKIAKSAEFNWLSFNRRAHKAYDNKTYDQCSPAWPPGLEITQFYEWLWSMCGGKKQPRKKIKYTILLFPPNCTAFQKSHSVVNFKYQCNDCANNYCTIFPHFGLQVKYSIWWTE